jgi:Histidine kinase-, DNA gyrase B-, and HSP90-like ATPase
VFERFVRGGGDGGRGSGLGLAIVHAVAESHGGTVALDEDSETGTRFVIRLPAASLEEPPDTPQPDTAGEAAAVAQTSTTTGSTIGRRRSRS